MKHHAEIFTRSNENMQDPVRTRQNSPVDESGVEAGCVLTTVHVEQNQVEVSLNEVHTQLLPECCSPLARLCVRLIQLLLVLDLEIISKVIYKTPHAPKSQREWFSFRQLFESGTFSQPYGSLRVRSCLQTTYYCQI